MGPSAAVSAIDPASANRRATGALVSIVIPCYKQARFLADAIESALAQTYRTIEIVVVNDGSPDETAAVAARYPPVRYIEQDNAGLAAARNTGLANSCGEFVVFLDADDRLLRDAVQTNVDRLTADEAVAFVAGLSYYIASDGSPLPTDQPRLPEGDLHAVLLARNRISTPACVMFRRSALDAIGGFDTRVDACADYEMYLRVSRAFPVAFHGQMVAEYRRHGDNMSLDAPRMLRDLCAIMRRQRRLLRGDEARLDAWRQGRRNIREYYGDHVANRIRERVRERMEWGSVVADTLTLLVHHPRGLFAHVFRKTVTSVQKIYPPQEMDVQIDRAPALLVGGRSALNR